MVHGDHAGLTIREVSYGWAASLSTGASGSVLDALQNHRDNLRGNGYRKGEIEQLERGESR